MSRTSKRMQPITISMVIWLGVYPNLDKIVKFEHIQFIILP
jgi:hypothetical protein